MRPLRSRVGWLLGVLALGGCGAAMRGAPAVRVAGVEAREGVTVHDVEYAGVDGATVKAYLVLPAAGGRVPAVVYTHPAPGSRATYLDEAVLLGRRGVASLVLSAPWSERAFWMPLFKDGAADRARYSRVVEGLRRAVDVVAARPEVDAGRIGYVGHSFGASFGGVLVAADPRVRAAILIAGPPTFTSIAALNNPALRGEARDRYAASMAPLEPVRHVGRAAPRPVLFQLPRQDELFPPDTLLRYSAAARPPTEVRWYDGDHALKTPAAREDRIEWLVRMLGAGPRERQ
ncbi:MAG: dienelactone hydrolase family protein [Gemmatimonadetes bacterium]|nr:dienelactone hydrolase family protein [Gemmatimonadota bacterium]